MASTLPPPAPSSGNLSWNSQSGPARSGWAKNDTGPASRGAPKGRAGGGRGGRSSRGGRGGNSGRGGAVSTQNGHKPLKDESKDKSLADGPKAGATPIPVSALNSAPLPNKPSSRPKPTRKVSEIKVSRKASANGADSVPPTPLNPSAPSATAPRPSNRRKRSHSKAVSSAPSKSSLSSESSLSQLRSESNVQITKDLPPHLVVTSEQPSFDIKNNIDALVERVRAIAMDRPHTPGSHFDWASDDDDSLPELPDWGLSASRPDVSSQSGKGSIISPILEDALKPLPSLDPGTPVIITSDDSVVDKYHDVSVDAPLAPKAAKDERKRHSLVTPQSDGSKKGQDTSKSDVHTRGPEQLQAVEVKADLTKPNSTDVPVSLPKDMSPKTAKLPLHPSLPPKPAASADSAAPKRHSRHVTGEPARAHPPSKPPVPDLALESGIAQSMHAPAASKSAVAEEKQTEDSRSPERGLGASIHAPMPPSMSAPSHLSGHPAADMPQMRSRTLARGHRQPHSASVSNFPGHISDSDRLSRDNAHHARTHSSPPVGSGTSTAHARSIHATRPVITVDAISRLARTLGGSPLSKREAAAIAAAKD